MEQEPKLIDVTITGEEKVESDLVIALSESDASQSQEDIQIELESDKSEVEVVFDSTEELDEKKTSEFKVSIEQESQDAEFVVGVAEQSESYEQVSVEGKLTRFLKITNMFF